jgi:hypothetical protein
LNREEHEEHEGMQSWNNRPAGEGGGVNQTFSNSVRPERSAEGAKSKGALRIKTLARRVDLFQ